MNEAQLKSLVLSKRKITIVGKIESIASTSDLSMVELANTLGESPFSVTTLMPKFSFSVLSELDLIKKDDPIILDKNNPGRIVGKAVHVSWNIK